MSWKISKLDDFKNAIFLLLWCWMLWFLDNSDVFWLFWKEWFQILANVIWQHFKIELPSVSSGKMATKNISPLDFSSLRDTLANADTRKRYIRDWSNFVRFAGINESTERPSEEIFLNFLKNRREEGKLCGKSLQSLLSVLSTMSLHFYNFKADEVSLCLMDSYYQFFHSFYFLT